MTITSITVRRLKTGNGYNNVAHEATASVPAGCSIEDLDGIRNQLDLQVQAWNDKVTVETLRNDAESLEWTVKNLRSEKASLETEVESTKKMLKQMLKTPLEDAIAGSNPEVPF